MAMTGAVKDELSRVAVTKPCCRKAEVSATAAVRRRAAHRRRPDRHRGRARHRRRRPAGCARDIAEVYGHTERGASCSPPAACARAAATSSGWSRTARRWPGRPACSTPRAPGARAAAAGGRRRSLCDAEAAWRGAFLAHGSLTEPGRSSALEITCPGPEAALALVGAARRLGIAGQGPRGARRRPGGDPRRRRHRRAAHPARRPRQRAGLGGAADAPRGPGHRQPAGQLRRRQPAPLRPGGGGRRRPGGAGPGDPRRRRPRPPGQPPGELRLEHKQASLEELGPLAEPAADQGRRSPAGSAGCSRMADKRAAELGIPDTEADLPPDARRTTEPRCSVGRAADSAMGLWA